MNLNTFVAVNNGKRVDVDGFPKNQPYQCYDLAALYDKQVVKGGGLRTGNGAAAGVFFNFAGSPQSKFYTRVVNNPNDPNQIPPSGALIFWNYNLPGSGGFGHVDVCLSSNKRGFLGFDQNWGGAYAHKVQHDYKWVAGWLVPKGSAKPAAPVAKQYYILQRGDYLIGVAGRFRITLRKLLSLNPNIKDPNKVPAGLKVRVK